MMDEETARELVEAIRHFAEMFSGVVDEGPPANITWVFSMFQEPLKEIGEGLQLVSSSLDSIAEAIRERG